jgi:hypothetical protein
MTESTPAKARIVFDASKKEEFTLSSGLKQLHRKLRGVYSLDMYVDTAA